MSKEEQEQWLAIPEIPVYQVSDLGRIRRRFGSNFHFLRTSIDRGGYECVSLQCGGRETRRTVRVHRLVAAAFIGDPLPNHEVNHRNGSNADNRATNLEYVSHPDNMRHAYASGLLKARKGQAHHNAKLSDSAVQAIRNSELSNRELASKFGIGVRCVYRIKRRDSWTHV